MENTLLNWPKPPSACPASLLNRPVPGTIVCVAGLVILRQRPGTAKGVIFLTLEDETGTINIVIWRTIYEKFRRAVISGRLLKIKGRVQSENSVIHIIAEYIEDISNLKKPNHVSPIKLLIISFFLNFLFFGENVISQVENSEQESKEKILSTCFKI